MKKVTLEQIECEEVLGLLSFIPKFYAADGDIANEACWYLYDTKPVWIDQHNGWVNDGQGYEIGSYQDELDSQPSVLKGLVGEEAIFEIVEEVEAKLVWKVTINIDGDLYSDLFDHNPTKEEIESYVQSYIDEEDFWCEDEDPPPIEDIDTTVDQYRLIGVGGTRF